MSALSTKNKILTAARTLFVEHGYAGTSIGRIAQLAGINHSLVFHHFGNKAELWRAVKQAIVQEAYQQQPLLPTLTLPASEFLPQVMHNMISFYQANPDLIRMINWQRLERNTTPSPGLTPSPEAQAWSKALTHYQTTQQIKVNDKPEFIMGLILAVCTSIALDAKSFIPNTAEQQAYSEFCVNYITQTLLN